MPKSISPQPSLRSRGGIGGSARVLAEPTPSRWSDLRKRVLSALVLAPLALACVWVGGVVFIILAAILAVGLMIEWTQLCRHRARTLAPCLAGLGWIGLAVVALLRLRADPAAGRANLLFVVLVVWGSDVGAYLAGRLAGGPRLAPRISPGKTWSGAVGGLVVAAAIGVLTAFATTGGTHLLRAGAVSAGLSVVGQVGDLVESLAKRHFGVKDSGRLIPGHGGLLDRLDAALAVVPAAAILAYLLGPGVLLWQ